MVKVASTQCVVYNLEVDLRVGGKRRRRRRRRGRRGRMRHM